MRRAWPVSALAASVALLCVAPACSSSSSHEVCDAFPGDAPFASRDASTDGPHDATSDRVVVGTDATKPPGDADASPATDGAKGPKSDAADSGRRDTGLPPIAPYGKHTTGLSIAVATASGKVTRTLDITVPAACVAGHPFPIVFAFHGDGGSGADMYGSFPIEQASQAAGGEAIFVYPDGTNDNVDPSGTARAWDMYHDPGPYPYAYTPGQPAPADSDLASGNVDVDLFDTLVEMLRADYCVDASKIFITGMSAGGYFVNQLARWRSGVVRATAPQSGGAPFGDPDGTGDWQPPNYCVGTTGKVAALIIHGTADSTVDPCNAIETQSYWELANGCTGASGNCTSSADSCTQSNLAGPSSAPTTTSPLNALVDAGTDCVQAEGCTAEPVVLCQVPGMGHEIWSSAPTVVWHFFSSL